MADPETNAPGSTDPTQPPVVSAPVPPATAPAKPAPGSAESTLPAIEIDPKFAKAIDPSTPPPIRMMAARGIVAGAKPTDIIHIQYALTFDPVEMVSSSAKKALTETPANLIKGAITDKTHPGVLDFLARNRGQDFEFMEFIALRKQVLDETLAHLAETSAALNVVEIIGKNQERLLQNPRLLDALRKNPVTPKSLIDVTIAFLQMAGVLPTGIEARSAGLPEKIDKSHVDAIIGDEVFDETLTREAGDGGETSADEKKTILQIIGDMNPAKKVKLAFRANKEARQILIRDSNRVVVGAVLNSGRLTDSEIVSMSMNPITSSETLRAIEKNRDWMRIYQVQKALALNPKSPQALSMRWLKNLRLPDITAASKNPTVPPAIRNLAKQIVEEKSKNR